jgi:uncharacterized SAM-binding protein YcdF (DUF218 family)
MPESRSWLVKDDPKEHADAMVILMGGISDKVMQASDLYAQKMAGKVIIVEESMGAYEAIKVRGACVISNTQQVCDVVVALGIPADSIIILPGEATSTQMEAMIIREYIKEYSGIDTLILISSAPHTRRASMIFKTALRRAEDKIFIICSPSAYTNFDSGKWWRSKEGIQTVLAEYLKMANFVLFEKMELN